MKTPTAYSIASQIRDLIQRSTGLPLPAQTMADMESILLNAYGGGTLQDRAQGFTDQQVTILLADLRGFMALAATYEAGVIIDMLNRCLARMSEIIFRHKGVIDKFMGDSIMVLFGAPIIRDDDVQRALHCAVEMQRAMAEINEFHRANGLPDLYMGIGINTGQVLAGMLGTDAYSEYTVIGDEVNLASRIEAFSLRGQILISETTFDHSRGFVVTGEPMVVLVKGKSQSVLLREVMSIPSLGLDVPRLEIRRSHRIEVNLPLTYQIIQDKIVLPQLFTGVARDIGYHGLLVELDQPVHPYTDLKLELNLPLVGFRITDLYAKVVNIQQRSGATFAGIEFTSVSAEVNMNIQMFTQLLILQR